jgi:hypothetical protein
MTAPFLQLTQHADPGSFRDFLLKSPALFVSLGESVGGISHIVSYWEYRFPRAARARRAGRGSGDPPGVRRLVRRPRPPNSAA